MSHILPNECKERGMNLEFNLPVRLKDVFRDHPFLSTLTEAVIIFTPISACIEFSSVDTSTMPDAYATMIFIWYFVHDSCLTSKQKPYRYSRLLYIEARIYSSILAFAFLWFVLQKSLSKLYPKVCCKLLGVSYGMFYWTMPFLPSSVGWRWRKLQVITRRFLKDAISTDLILRAIKCLYPQLAWGKMQNLIPRLSKD